MAEINEENNEVDPYESLAAAMSGNTETAVDAQEGESLETKASEPEAPATESEAPEVESEAPATESEAPVTEDKGLNVDSASADYPAKEKKQMAQGNGDSLESAFRIHRMFESIRDKKLAEGDKEGAEAYNSIIKSVDIGMAGYEGISPEEYETRRQAFEKSLKSENNQENVDSNNPKNNQENLDSNAPNNPNNPNQQTLSENDTAGEMEGGFRSIRSLEAIRDNYIKEGRADDAQHFDSIIKDVEVGMAAYHGVELQDYQQKKQDFYKQTENTEQTQQPAQAQPAPEQTQQPAQAQPAPNKAQEMELHPTNAGQAQTWFKVEGLVDKLDTHDLAGLQLAQKENPNNFTDAQRQQVNDLAWNKIQNVANRKDKLGPQDYKGFESLLKNVPASHRMETSKELDTVKSAETRLYRARNGIEDKSLGEKAKDGLNKAKVSGSKVLKQSKTGLKKAFDAGLKKVDKGKDKIVGRLNKFGKSVSAYAYKKKEKALGFIKNNKLVRGTKKLIKGAKKAYKGTVNFGKKVVNGTKKAYKGTINFGKKVYNGGKNVVKAVQNGYKRFQKIGANIAKSFKKELTDKEKAVKLSKGNLDKLTPEQVAFAYKNLKDIDQKRDPHSKEVNALYAIKGFADRKMDAISADKSILTAGNAKQAAEWLNISQDVQDKVNHNQVESKNNRNNDVALALQSHGLDTKMVTAAEKQEAVNKTDVNSDTQAQAVKQEMANTSPENISQVQKNEQKAEEVAKPKEPEKQKPQAPAQPVYDSEALAAALSGNTGTAVNAMDAEKPNNPGASMSKSKDMAAEDKKILEQLSGRSNENTANHGQNSDKNITLDKAPSQEAPNPSNTFVATPEMFKEPQTNDKSSPAQESKADNPKSNNGSKKKLTKEQKIARKLFAKSGRGKSSTGGTKGSPTVVRTLDPKLKAAAKGGRQSA